MSITSFSSLSLCNNNNHNDKIHWDQNNNIYILFPVGINIYIGIFKYNNNRNDS